MVSPPWWIMLRRLVTFALGVSVVLDALLGSGENLGKLLIGALMIGVLPVEDVARIITDRRHTDDRTP